MISEISIYLIDINLQFTYLYLTTITHIFGPVYNLYIYVQYSIEIQFKIHNASLSILVIVLFPVVRSEWASADRGTHTQEDNCQGRGGRFGYTLSL